ncbi:hypothetical protein N7462_002942 [Penicillium macrosclerotiorum]|uniref:uncharacterized protein n=1 Tax=Penicillium macrosclerotiorum TaxID=303699 RepID=UPI002546F693|nr:uncharacterized protein N7462_002942 [Penicillium macrosclerotiorum]KAJ5688550.1 hypothetical protein N7462_002942 [Penicillium macrosclerotiorum]
MDAPSLDDNISLEACRKQKNLDPFEKRLFCILNDVLQPDVSLPSEAARLVNKLIEEKNSVKETEDFLWLFWGLVIRCIRLVPHTHPNQIVNSGNKVNINSGNAEEIAQWINQNSFMARLVGEGLLDWTNLVIWMMREALEESPSQGQSSADCYVLVVGEWMTYAGEVIFHQVNDEHLTEQQQRMTKGGSLYRGNAGLCRERWDFWRTRLGELGQVVSPDAQPIARSALERMADIERTCKHRP